MTNGDVGGGGPPQPVTGNGPFAPAWIMSPVPPDAREINVDVLSFEFAKAKLSYTIETGRPSLSGQAPGLREIHDLDGARARFLSVPTRV